MGLNIFIYGTLKRGEPNHWLIKKLRRHARFLSLGFTKDCVPLVIDSENSNVPILLDLPGEGQVVEGQVYVIDKLGIEILDLFLENPKRNLRREKVKIHLNNKFLVSHEDQDKIDCQCYYIDSEKTDEIERLRKLPTIDCYESNGEHGKPYSDKSHDLEIGSKIIKTLIGEEIFLERRDFTDDSSAISASD